VLKQLVPQRIKQSLKRSLGVPSSEAALRRLKARGFNPSRVIDVGANVGEWTRMCKRLWPKARLLMIEPLPECEASLAHLASQFSDVRYERALLGASIQPAVAFHLCNTASSVLQEYEAEHASIELPMTTLDNFSSDAELLKVDVQGYELEILKAGTRTLASAEVVILEAHLLDLHIGGPLIHELLHFMVEHGFVLYDTGDHYRRPLDQALWCMDLIFVRREGRWRASKRWS
jgi:FkbM family methyltransferase